jgi:hypothetical protein
MGARDSDDDIRKYLPDLDTILREADPARGQAKLQEAQDNPELDKALAELKQGLKDGESPFEFPTVPVRGKGAAEVGPVTAPIAAPAGKRGPREERRWMRGWIICAFALLGVLGSLAMVVIVSKAPPVPPVASAVVSRAVPTGSGRASASGAATTASPVASADAGVHREEPPAPSTTGAPSSLPSASAAPAVAPPVVPKLPKQGGAGAPPPPASTSAPSASPPPPAPKFVE